MKESHPSKVGKQEVPLKLSLFTTVYIPTLLYNMEGRARIEKDEMKELEDTQASTLRRLLNVPKTTSYLGILNETGIWNIQHQFMYKRLMLYHNIMNSKKEERFVKQVILEEESNPFEGCWAEKVQEDAEKLDMKPEKMRKELKSKVKKDIKKAIEKSMQKSIQQNLTKKLRTVSKLDFCMKEYLQGGFNGEEVSDILKTKLHMLEFKANYRNADTQYECRLCGKEEETTEHIFLKL